MRERSSSGGVFSVLADWVLEREGAVFAAGYGPDLRVAHREVDGKEQLDRVRRTKYVQSGMDGVYGAIRDRPPPPESGRNTSVSWASGTAGKSGTLSFGISAERTTATRFPGKTGARSGRIRCMRIRTAGCMSRI